MKPSYVTDLLARDVLLDDEADGLFVSLMHDVRWLDVAQGARLEAFYAATLTPVRYTYGRGRGQRTYVSRPMSDVADLRWLTQRVNHWLADRGHGPLNGCFLNRYDGAHNAIGWHSDDDPGTDHTKPIVVLSLGQERDLYTRPLGHKGPLLDEWKWTLGHGSLFVMPPGFQQTHQHKIAKASGTVRTRISLTWRAFVQKLDMSTLPA